MLTQPKSDFEYGQILCNVSEDVTSNDQVWFEIAANLLRFALKLKSSMATFRENKLDPSKNFIASLMTESN